MPHRCAFGCKDTGNVMHSFPNPDKFPERFKAWVDLVGNNLGTLTDYDIYKKKRICDIHFTDEHRNRFERLNALAMPTLYLPGKSHGITATAGQSEANLSFSHPTTNISLPSISISTPGSDNVALHMFPDPDNDADRFRTWLYTIGGDILELDNQKIMRYRKVCDCHFEEIYHTRSKRLSSNAVPTLYVPVSAPGTSRATGSTIDIIQTPNSSGETKTIAEALPTLKSNLLKPVIEDKVQDATETTQELPSCSTTVEHTDICDDNDDADDDSDTLVESNICRVCLAMDVKMYDLNNTELREMFQNITGIAVTENNHPILEHLCWECAGRLKAAAAFRNKALLSDALLQGLANTGEQIRKNDITLIKDSEDYLKTAATLTAVEAFHTVDIDPENDGIPPLSENNDTKIVQNTVRKDFLKLKNKSMNEKDNDPTDVEDESMIEAPINTEMEYDQFNHICPNAGEESRNICVETNPLFSSNIPLKEVTINSANSSPLPSCSHVKPKYPVLGYRLKTPGDCEDKIKNHVIKITKRDLISKIVFKNAKELISAKSKSINVKKGGISKKTSNLKLLKYTQVKANTPTDEEIQSFENI